LDIGYDPLPMLLPCEIHLTSSMLNSGHVMQGPNWGRMVRWIARPNHEVVTCSIC
jgi:hypothetical protein